MNKHNRINYLCASIPDSRIVKIIDGIDGLERIYFGFGCGHRALPPALLPFWTNELSAKGLWRHWFVERSISYTGLMSEGAYEGARTLDQFLDEWFVQEISCEGGVTDEVQKLATHLGYNNIDEILKFVESWAASSMDLIALRSFASSKPLSVLADPHDYDGEFPTPVLAHAAKWENCCQFEANAAMRSVLCRKHPEQFDIEPWQAYINAQPWLSADTDKLDVFRHYFQAGNYGKAWLALNARGWERIAARTALDQLLGKTSDPLFGLMVASWEEMCEDWSGSY